MLGADASKLCKDTQSVRQSRAAWGTRTGESIAEVIEDDPVEIPMEIKNLK